jgi:PAS domain S-box-containing protein
MRKKELTEKNRIFETILQHTHMMVVLLDSDFNFIWVNSAYAKTCGQDASFFPGKNHFELYPNDEILKIFKQVAETGDPFYITAKPFVFPDQPERGVTYWDWSLIPAKDMDNAVIGLVFTLVEVTDRISAEIALKKSEAQYRELVQNTNSAIIRWKVDGTLVFFNEYAQKFFGYSKDEVLGRNVSILIPEEDSLGKDLKELVKDIVTNPEQYINNVNENICSDGTRVWMAWTNKPVLDENGNVVEILAVGTDITALKNAETALMKSENEKSLILENADELIAYHNRENNLVWANRAYLKATGKTLSQLKGNKCFYCWGLTKLCTNCPVIRAIETGKPQSGELTPENQAHWHADQGSWDIRSAPVRDTEGNIIGAIEMAHDITERKKAEIKIESSLKEKEILLKEIHHRVKNNMQIISSLVSLQANQLPESGPREILRNVSNRVRSMAMVHEKLYQSANLSSIDFARYADSLISYLWRSYVSTSSEIHLVKNLSPVLLSVDEAIPLGLILNELISNVLKHAFEGLTEGELTVTLKEDEKNRIVLSVCDNGKGLPAGFDPDKSKSLGMRLVQMLAAQLHAHVDVTGVNGTEFKLILGRK